MTMRHSVASLSVYLVAPLTFVLAPSIQALEAKVFAIGDFVPSASGGCNGADVSHWPDMLDEWYDEMGSQGETKDGQYTNGTMTVERFCDVDWNGDCDDDDYVDDADAAMVGFHGADSSDHWAGTMRSPWNSECALDAGGSGVNMSLGDIDAEFFHAASCQSADDDNLSGIRNAMTDPIDGGFAHQWDGFHGLMWIGDGYDNNYEDFADDAHSERMSDAWVTNHFDDTVDCEGYDPFDWFNTCVDQCPVAYAISTSESDVLTRLNNERYNNVYSDPTGNGWYAISYIENCDPAGEYPFNP